MTTETLPPEDTGGLPLPEGFGPLPDSVSAQILLLYVALLGARQVALRLADSFDPAVRPVPDALIHGCDHLDLAARYLELSVRHGGGE